MLLDNNSHLRADALQRLQRLFELLVCVRRAHDGTDAGLALGHRGKSNACTQHALFEQFAGEFHRQAAFTHNNRRDRGLAGGSIHSSDVEAQAP